MERVEGIEPSRPAWEAGRLPLHHTRIGLALYRSVGFIANSKRRRESEFWRSLVSICGRGPALVF